jgi:hypothetical protein
METGWVRGESKANAILRLRAQDDTREWMTPRIRVMGSEIPPASG